MKLSRDKKPEPAPDEDLIKDSRQLAMEKASEIKDSLAQPMEMLKEPDKSEESFYNQLLRERADFDNYRKRVNKEREEYQATLKQEIIYDFLAIVDNFERALKVAEESKDFAQLLEGIKMVHKQINDFFKDHGVTPMVSEGKPFDPHTSEAIAQEESDLPEHTVVEEMQKGYFLNDRVLRTAKVKVAVPKTPEEDKKEEVENG